jgi:sensor histidine kinase YesM
MFHTKVVEKVKTLILCPITLSPKSRRLWDNVEKYGRIRRATYDSTAHALCVLDICGYRSWEYEILIAFPWQQWLLEGVSMLRLYVNCLSCLLTRHSSVSQLTGTTFSTPARTDSLLTEYHPSYTRTQSRDHITVHTNHCYEISYKSGM